MAISFLGAFLILSALFCFYKALDLIPTDLGLSWFQGGFTLFAAGAIVLALALAVKALRDSMLIPIKAERPADAPVRTDPPMAPAPADAAAFVEPAKGFGNLGKAGAIAAAGVAAGALAGAAHGMGKDGASASSGDTADDKILEELERDLFDEVALPKPADEAVSETVTEDEADGLKAADARLEISPLLTPDIAEVIAPELADERADPDVLASPLAQSIGPEADVAEEHAGGVADDTTIEDLLEPVQEQAKDSDVGIENELPAENSHSAEHGHTLQTSPGLIADDDLAALDHEEPALAPIETLDVVGSYDSGGSRFTMYSDGSVNTVGPDGERRFRNLEALRAYIDGVTRQ